MHKYLILLSSCVDATKDLVLSRDAQRLLRGSQAFAKITSELQPPLRYSYFPRYTSVAEPCYTGFINAAWPIDARDGMNGPRHAYRDKVKGIYSDPKFIASVERSFADYLQWHTLAAGDHIKTKWHDDGRAPHIFFLESNGSWMHDEGSTYTDHNLFTLRSADALMACTCLFLEKLYLRLAEY